MAKQANPFPLQIPVTKHGGLEKQAVLEAERSLNDDLPFWMGPQVLLLYRACRVPALTSQTPGGTMKPLVSLHPSAAGVPRAGAAR